MPGVRTGGLNWFLTGRDRTKDGSALLVAGLALFLFCGILLLPPAIQRLAAAAALLCASGVLLVLSDIRDRGFVAFLPSHLRELLTEGTLLQFLRDDSLPKTVIPYVPFLISLSDEEVQAYLRTAPLAVQELMTRRGLARLLPTAAQHWLLGRGSVEKRSTATNPQTALVTVEGSGEPVATPSVVALAAAVRASRPTAEAPPWAAHALSTLVRRRALRTAAHALGACGITSEGAALDAAMAVTVARAGRALLLPRAWAPLGNAVATVLNAVTLVAWSAYVARRGVDAALRALDAGSGPARPMLQACDGRHDSRPSQVAPATNLARALGYARALIAFYAARVARAPLRSGAAAALMTLLLIVVALRSSRRAIQL